jgi:hypothetical protein
MKKQLLLITCILALAACRKDIAPDPCTDPLDPNCVTYHPCNGVQPVTADFEMWYGSYLGGTDLKGRWVVQDSVFPPGDILFKAELNGAQYQFILGLDTVTEQQDYRRFVKSFWNDTSIYSTYYNTLTVWKTPNLSCYPNEQAMARLTRSITIKRPSQLLTSGMFKVLYDGDTDSTLIQIKTWALTSMGTIERDAENPGYRYFIGFKGLRRDTFMTEGSNRGFWYTDKLIILPGGSMPSLDHPQNGYIRVDPHTLIIEGKYELKWPSQVSYTFKGVKLQ